MSVRALVVDDSRTMAAIISGLLSADPEIEVIGTAACPAEAREKIKQLSPDVITLDIEMPGMNGLDFLEKVMRLRPMPVVMVSTLTAPGAAASLQALELGAFDCYPKPRSARADDGRLAAIVKQAAASRVRARAALASPARPAPGAAYRPRADALVAIGSSTGGVEALIELLATWPAHCPPTVITQHMPALFTASFAARLDRLCLPTVQEARSGAPLLPGNVYLAPGGEQHLEVQGHGPQRRCRLVSGDLVTGHRPSVDRLFHSVARCAGASAVGAILTGMGRDGAEGLKAMREAGAVTIGQDEASCVVYGMPQAAFRIGAVEAQLPLRSIGPRLLQECQA